METEEPQRVMVIQDTSRDVSWTAIRWVLPRLSLKPGDEFMLFGVLHEVINPMGYRSKVDCSLFGTNQNQVEGEMSRKKEEYSKNMEMVLLLNQCKTDKIKICVEVEAGSSSKEVALKGAKTFRATWVIFGRHMKKDKKYFLENLSCRISRIKRNNTVEKLRGPLKGKSPTNNVKHNEMIPGSRDKKLSPHKSPRTRKTTGGKERRSSGGRGPPLENHRKLPLSKSFSSEHVMLTTTISSSRHGTIDASSSSYGEDKDLPIHFQKEESTIDTAHKADIGNLNGLDEHIIEGKQKGIFKLEKAFKNTTCSVCKNRRPNVQLNKEFTYAELHAATEGFSKDNFLSEGGFGSVYQGALSNGLKIAVKQRKDASCQGEKEFKSEVHVLSQVRHENLVMLIGSCSEESHKMLVYEYVCDGSLDQHLSIHANKPLSWFERIKIALGAAKGLEYLHKNNIIHRDVRPNNILVTHDRQALLGDFGLARNQHDDSEDSKGKLVGTLGYLAPEYVESGKASSITDVYSFGVVLLQLITGMTMEDQIKGGISLIGWARPLLKEKNYPDLIDKRIVDCHDMYQLFCMVRLAEKCISKDPKKRFSMTTVAKALTKLNEGNKISTRDLSPADFEWSNTIMLHLMASPCTDKDDNSTDIVNAAVPIEEETLIVTQLPLSARRAKPASYDVDKEPLPPPSPPPTPLSPLPRGNGNGNGKSTSKRRGTSQKRGKMLLYDEMVV
ncbi:Non-specific serine/threonine protein kinase [Bertholletia excelsa]